jgi:hypothetical protein
LKKGFTETGTDGAGRTGYEDFHLTYGSAAS